ncbi:N-acetylmuramoyl-L-alanine amidase-like domain-containing protein [Cyclobacterium jeungdonense]|uniref:DUF1460 domain-containing protein n=1 Tax=Cyclobacterium jeungdonense TaxID=708087 RepID=A0ABT8C9S8_9BACT|nr:N-acetylmuramoyl-L-alanine amidase-like domain-containing protein [Cyclobacterium jeungdonense]MDN3689558.1 DUF1460 domain-containing protein [Cyclobacterium jeungdonense]
MRLTALILCFIPVLLQGQTVCSVESRNILEAAFSELSQTKYSKLSTNDLIVNIGSQFIHTPYVEKTLELPGEEKLVIDVMGLDCTTFLETVVVLARLTKQGRLSFEDYEQELEFLRYRDGIKRDYSSRLHYFSDWTYQNQRKGILNDITSEMGGRYYENKPSFMSANPRFYVQLNNPEFLVQLKAIEEEIKLRTYSFVPKEELSRHVDKIKPGDLIAITTTMKNLDIVHVGFAIEQNGLIHLLHASTRSMQVEISDKPLSDYLKGNKSQSGIMVSRLVRP